MKTIQPIGKLRGSITVPGDKSISHRSIILGSIAEGTTEVVGFLPSADCLSTIACFQQMGVKINQLEEDRVIIDGVGLHGLQEPNDVLNANNSGTTARLLMGILAGQNFFSCLSGDSSLRNRPMGRVIKPLKMMGADITGRSESNLLPLAIKGCQLKAIEYVLPVASAQLKSAILLAGLYGDDKVVVIEKLQSRDHTEKMLQSFGVQLTNEGPNISLIPPQKIEGQKVIIPGDISSAAFFLVAGLILPDSEILIKNVGINPSRNGCLKVLKAMGGNISLINERNYGYEPVADILVKSSELKGTIIEGEIIPTLIDEIPILAVAALYAQGKTIIKDAKELRVKESDRIAVIIEEFRKLQAHMEELEDGLIIEGGYPLRGAECNSHGDHRIAMSLAIAALGAKNNTIIHDSGCVNISYPDFWDDLAKLSK